MTKHVSLLVMMLSAACRLGGPEGSPTALTEPAPDAPVEEPDDDEDDAVTADPPAPGPEPSAPPPATVDAATPAAPGAPSTSCQAPANLECDPVSGEGCFPLMQCVVDPTSTKPAAYCLFSGLLLDVTCLQDDISTNCPPQFTCVMGECRKYCYCDADCDDGAPCSDASGEGGSDAFKICGR